MKTLKIIPLFLLPILLLTSGCGKDSEFGFITLLFDHSVGGEDLVFDAIRYPCAAGHKFSVVRIKYYLSNFVFHKADGTVFQVEEVHYREAALAETRNFTLKEVPNGEYTSLSFILGLDEATNVSGGLENNLTNINMEWPIPGEQGYHYMKFEGKYDSLDTGNIKNFNLHTGATGGNQNFVNVTLPLNSLRMSGDHWNITLQMDLTEWLQNPNTYDFEEFGPLIMANQDAQEVLKTNGATVFSVVSMEKQ